VFELVAHHPDAADDLVAVLYADPEGPALTEPLANADLGFIDQTRSADPGFVEAAMMALRAIPIEKRTPSALIACLRDFPSATEHFSRTPILRNYKADNARLLLQCLVRSTDL
jgi:hypothetical protein